MDAKDFKFAHVLKRSVTNSTPMDLQKTTVDHDRQGQPAHRRYRQITHSSWVCFR